MRNRYKLLAVIVSLVILAALSAKAQDPNFRDTVYVDSVFTNLPTAVVPVYLWNDQPLLGIEVTLKHSQTPSFMVFDSVSFASSRISYITNKFYTNHVADSAFTVSAFVFSESILPIGNGLLCRLYFTLTGPLDSQLVTIDSTTVNVDEAEWTVRLSDSTATQFKPSFKPGKVYINNAICCINNRGNADGDPQDVANILDLNFMVNRVFRGGPAPSCPEEADISVDGTVNIIDLNLFVNFVFRGNFIMPPCQ